jgi:hypothetical protein
MRSAASRAPSSEAAAAKAGRRPGLEPPKTQIRRTGIGSAAPTLVRPGFVDLDEKGLLGPHGEGNAPRLAARGTGDFDERGADVARPPSIVEVRDVEAGAARTALVWIALAVPRRHGSVSIIPVFEEPA